MFSSFVWICKQKKTIRLIAGSLFVCCIFFWLASSNEEGAKVQMTKAEYLEGEPLEVELVLCNYHDSPIIAHIAYPTPSESHLFGFIAKPDEAVLGLRSQIGGENHLIFHPIIFQTIKSHEESRIRFYLQRFIEQPGPGDYQLPFTVEIPYGYGPTQEPTSPPIVDSWVNKLGRAIGIHGASRRTLATHGVLSFSIIRGKPEQLKVVQDQYRKELRSFNAWKQRQAREALSSTGALGSDQDVEIHAIP